MPQALSSAPRDRLQSFCDSRFSIATNSGFPLPQKHPPEAAHDLSMWKRNGCRAALRSLVFWCNMEATVAKGTVKWFNATKGYGFIQPMGGGKDVFVHISAVERAGLSTLNEGQTVEYEEVANKGKTSAENLRVAGR
jgi:cold shock protein